MLRILNLLHASPSKEYILYKNITTGKFKFSFFLIFTHTVNTPHCLIFKKCEKFLIENLKIIWKLSAVPRCVTPLQPQTTIIFNLDQYLNVKEIPRPPPPVPSQFQLMYNFL